MVALKTLQGSTPNKLEDIFGNLADTQTELFREGRAPVRNRKVSELAATGRLSSGIAEHSLGALDRDTALGESNIRAGILPSIATGALQDDSQTFQSEEAEKEFGRNMELARMIGKMNKPSGLSEIFGGIGAAGKLAGGVAGLASGNPLAAAPLLSAGTGLMEDGADLEGIFGGGSPSRPNLSLYNRNNYPQRRYFDN